MSFFRKKRETRLIFRDKTVRLVSGGEPDEQTGQVTIKVADIGFLKKSWPVTVPMCVIEMDPVSIMTAKQIRINIPNFYANGQPVKTADRREMMLMDRMMQLEKQLSFERKQLNSANQALDDASMNPENMFDKRVAEVEKLMNVVGPFMRPVSKKGGQMPSIFMPPEMPQQYPQVEEQ